MKWQISIAGVVLLALLMWLLWPGVFGLTEIDGRDRPEASDADPRLLRGESMPRLHGRAPRTDSPHVDALDAASVEVDDERELTLRLDTVDARTGGRLVAQWNVVTTAPEAIAKSRRAIDAWRAKWEAAFIDSGERLAVGRFASAAAHFPIIVRPPPRFVLLDKLTMLTRRIAVDARETYAILPLWPEVLLNLRVLAADDRPIEHIGFTRFVAAGRIRDVTFERRAPGEFLVRKIPFFPGEPVAVHIDEDTLHDATGEFVEEDVSDDEVLGPPDLKTMIPATLFEPWSETVRVVAKDPRSSMIDDLEYEESLSETAYDGARASVHVRVLDRAGEPIVGAGVLSGVTNAKGEVVLDEVPVGSQTLVAYAKGRLPASGTASVVEGAVARVTLREPGGARLHVVVLGKDGMPMPFAQLSLQGTVFFDVEDGVQRLDMFTDRVGRRTFARVLPGDATLVAFWGSRTARVRVSFEEGQTTRVELRLASPTD